MIKIDQKTRTLMVCAVAVGIMLGLVSQAPFLYRMFCGATGYGGTTQRVATGPQSVPAPVKEREITVHFDGNVDAGLPWTFAPDVKDVTVKLGEEKVIKYHATNMGTKTTVGTAVHNVQPDKAGLYFDKVQCFCFTKQVLKPGQTEELAVQFYIDPAMAEDRNEDDVKDITLSYTFFLAKDQKKAKILKQANITTPDTPKAP